MTNADDRLRRDAEQADAEAGYPRRRDRLARLAATPWPKLLLRFALQLLALFVLASLLVWLSGRL